MLLSFLSFRSDCGHRLSPSADRMRWGPATRHGILCVIASVRYGVCEWKMCYAALQPGQVCGVSGGSLYCLFMVSSTAVSFSGCKAYMPYIWQAHCATSSASLPSQARLVLRWSRCIVQPTAICYLTANTHYNPDECNGLSQFREDTNKPSIAVQEFNFIACLLA